MRFFLKDNEVETLSKYGLFLINFLAVVFIALIWLAIHSYPGNYNFLSNYLSDLGRKTVGGYDNSTSSMYFTLAMIFAGIIGIIFWLLSQNVIYLSDIEIPFKFKYFVLIGSIIGFISAIFNILIGFFPLDTQQQNHYLVGEIFFSLGGIACTLYAIFFIYLFFYHKTDSKVFEGSILSILIPIAFAFLLLGYINDISEYNIILLIILLMILNIIFVFAFMSLLDYLSYIISFSMIVLESIIVMLLLSYGLKPINEVTFVLGIIVFIMTNNIRILRFHRYN